MLQQFRPTLLREQSEDSSDSYWRSAVLGWALGVGVTLLAAYSVYAFVVLTP